MRKQGRMTIAAALAGMCLGGSVAHGHASLTESEPADGAVLDEAPEEIVLTFSEPVRLTAVSLERDGLGIPLGPLPIDRGERLAVDAPELDAGEYAMSWRVISEDTHVVTGEVTFTISDGAGS